jgi:NADH dehydrogenase
VRILALGGAGFIGRHACAALLERGHVVVIGSRHARRNDRRLAPALRQLERRRVRMEHLTEPADWSALTADVDVVLNCVGILRPRWGETYDAVHHRAVAALGAAARKQGIRMVHVSALGLCGDARSGFVRSKRQGEQALLAAGGDAIIVRPSLLDGIDGFGSRWLHRVARWPIHCVPADALGRLAPLDVDDLAWALAALCEDRARATPRIVELGGADTRSMGEHLAALRRQHHGLPAPLLHVPALIARAVSRICDVLHVTPFSFGHLELMRTDNVPSFNALPSLIGRAPRRVGVPEGRSPRALVTRRFARLL